MKLLKSDIIIATTNVNITASNTGTTEIANGLQVKSFKMFV